MIKSNQERFNRMHILLDFLVVLGIYFLTFLLFFYVIPSESIFGGTFSGTVTRREYILASCYIVPINMIYYALFRLYRPKRVTGRRLEAANIVKGNFATLLTVILMYWIFLREYADFSRMFLFWFACLNSFGVVLERNIVRYVLVAVRKKGFNQKHIIIVGYSRAAEGFLDRVKNNTQWGYHVYGILDDNMDIGIEYKTFHVVGDIDQLEGILATNKIDEVFVTLRLREYEKLEYVVNTCEKAGIHTKFVPDYNNIISNRPYTEDLLGLPVISIRQVPLNDPVNYVVKRVFDIVGSFLCIVLFSPMMLISAIAVRLSSPGPIIYKQERVGLHNRPFMMFKFRSMGVQKPSSEKDKWTTKTDPRVTTVGKIIRKTSIDELPQLFNVLSGKMSLVGPRPERPFFVEKFKEEIPRYMVKHQVRPGMTGWAQINGLRGDTSIRDRIDHDIYYIENWSFGLDCKILFLTVFKGFINKNAY